MGILRTRRTDRPIGSRARPAEEPLDLDLHGIVLRLLDARPPDLRVVQRQFPGVTPRAAEGGADVVVRFVDTLAMNGTVRRIGRDLVDDDGLVLVRPGVGRTALVRVPIDVEGGTLECERHVLEVPLLLTLVRLTGLRQGLLPLHAVAFHHQETGVAVTGWSGSGKTAALIAMLAAGATPVGAEWVLVTSDGRDLFPVPQPVRLKPSHIERWPRLGHAAPAGTRARLRLLAAVGPTLRRLAPRVGAAAERAMHVDVSLVRIAEIAGIRPFVVPCGRLDLVIVLEDAEVTQPTLQRLQTAGAVERIAVALDHDFGELHAARRALHFSRGSRLDDPLGADSADKVQRDLLAQHLGSRPVYLLRHRQPTPFEALRTAIEEALS